MSGPRGPLLIISVVLAAFLFGYKQESFVSTVRAKWSQWTSTATETPKAPSGPIAGAVAPPTPAPPTAAAPAPYPGAPLNTAGGTPVTQGPSLAQSLDSVTAGAVQPKQEERRNLYFEKLSEQLRELRGENPPPAAPAQGALPPPPPPPAPTPPSPDETIADEEDVPADETIEPDDGADTEDEEQLSDEEPEE